MSRLGVPATTPPPSADPAITTVPGAGGLGLTVHQRGPVDRPTIVLVHGYPDDHHVWDLVVDRLADRYRVVTYDVRGAGTSDVPETTAGYRLEALVTDLAAVVDAVSDRPVHVVGHDWGSIQAWSAMIDPAVNRRFASYTSMSGPGLELVANWTAARRRPGGGRWRQAATQAVHSWYIYAFHTPLAPVAWRAIGPRWATLLRRQEPVIVDDRWPGPGLTADAVRGIRLYRANVLRTLRHPRPIHTDVPVQLVIPTGDPFVSTALLADVEATAPDLVRVELDAKHWIPRSHPDDVARLVAEHVERVEARAAAPVAAP